IVGALLSLAFLKIFKPRKMWGKIALKDRLTTEAGYTTLTEEYKNLISQSGITLTDMKPTGTVKINEKEYSAVSNGNSIKKDKKNVGENRYKRSINNRSKIYNSNSRI